MASRALLHRPAALLRAAARRLHGEPRTAHVQLDELRAAYRELEEGSLRTIEALNAAVEAKDPCTIGHSARVQRIAVAIGGELGLDGDTLTKLGDAALFHDIGKIAVPDALLVKPTRLALDEVELMQRHAAHGAEIVSRVPRLRAAAALVRHHHERWDGTGYPDCLAGEEIPLEAAVLGLADAWDAMTTDRPYHRALTLEEAFREVRAHRGTQFSPAVVDAFLAAARRTPGELTGASESLADAG